VRNCSKPLLACFFRRASLCAVLAGCLPTGCSLHSVDESVRPAVSGGEAFSVSVDGVALEHRWWRALGDERLTALVEEALSGNLDMQRARLRIDQAAAWDRQAAARLLPALDAGAAAEREWPDRGVKHNDHLAGSVRLSWEVDLWQRLASARKAAELETAAAREDAEAMALLLSAEVAETYFGVVEQELQLALLARQVEAGKTLLGLIELRFGQGQASVVDVYQQRQQLASTQAQLPQIRSRRRVLENRLKVLLARSPVGEPAPVSPDLPSLPPLPKLGVPSSLLANRPDLRRIRCQLIASDYRVAEAVAARLPQLTIGLERSYRGTDFRRLTPEGLFTSLAGELAAPVIDWGEREAEVRRRQAVVREHLLAMSQAYLAAVEEVEDALWQERRRRELIAALEKELGIAQRNLKETRIRYGQGLTDYLPVLAAVQSLQALERNLLTRRRELVSIRILLYRALGGARPRVPAAPADDGKPQANDGPEEKRRP
jgi:NodT family efflux transporter outer membrane factor (OMF) lipoprotein